MTDKDIVVAILAKQKAHCIGIYLQCILKQTFEKKRIRLYIRTNNNTDTTAELLEDWIKQYGDLYKSVYFNKDDVEKKVERYAPHEWNAERFSVLAKIRQDSIQYAIDHEAHYFVADCDNFIFPGVIEKCFAPGLDVVAPMLNRWQHGYSNYHSAIDAHGYFKQTDHYFRILNRDVIGYILVPVVHCTYFIDSRVLSSVSYMDETTNHEYVIFSRNLRKKGVPQFLDNMEPYGFISFADSVADFEKEGFLPQLVEILAKP
jgi:hypothetical protein